MYIHTDVHMCVCVRNFVFYCQFDDESFPDKHAVIKLLLNVLDFQSQHNIWDQINHRGEGVGRGCALEIVHKKKFSTQQGPTIG